MRTHLLIVAALQLAACGKSPDEVAVSALQAAVNAAKDGDNLVQTEEGTFIYNDKAGQALRLSSPREFIRSIHQPAACPV